MDYLKRRLSEPSSWAGLAVIWQLLAGFATGTVSPEMIGAAAAAIAAVLLPERGQ